MTIGKIGLIVLALSLAAPLRAAETSGTALWNIGVGANIPVSGLDLSAFGGGSERPGSMGLALSPQYLYVTSPRLALGGELTYMDMTGHSVSLPGGPAASSGDLVAFEAVGRYLLQDASGGSPYVTAGVGVGRYAVTVSQGPNDVINKSAWGIALFPGLGMRLSVTKKAEASVEARWQVGKAGRSDFGTNLYNIVGLFLRIGWLR